jgi:hypothetical protein
MKKLKYKKYKEQEIITSLEIIRNEWIKDKNIPIHCLKNVNIKKSFFPISQKKKNLKLKLYAFKTELIFLEIKEAFGTDSVYIFEKIIEKIKLKI